MHMTDWRFHIQASWVPRQ